MPVNVTDTLHVTSAEGVLAPTNEIYDKGLGKFQNQINASIPTVVLLSVWYDNYHGYLTFTETAQEIFDKISALKESDNDRIFVIREERIPGEVTYAVANVLKTQNHYFDIFWLSGNMYGSATINSDDGDKYVEIQERKGIPLSIDLLRNYKVQYAYDESLGKYSFVGELRELKEQFHDISVGSSSVIFVWNADTGYLYLASAKSTGSYKDQRVFNIAWVENEYPSDAGSSDTPTVSPKFCYVEFDMQATEKPEIHKIDYLPAGGGGGTSVTVVHTTGQSTTSVMAQKTVTDELNKLQPKPAVEGTAGQTLTKTGPNPEDVKWVTPSSSASPYERISQADVVSVVQLDDDPDVPSGGGSLTLAGEIADNTRIMIVGHVKIKDSAGVTTCYALSATYPVPLDSEVHIFDHGGTFVSATISGTTMTIYLETVSRDDCPEVTVTITGIYKLTI